MATYRLKDWLLRAKNEEVGVKFHGLFDTSEIIEEREKAFKVRMECNLDVPLIVWIPKSGVEIYEEAMARMDTAFEAGKTQYEAMIDWAKAHGVKGVRVGMRKVTILEKIEAAGLKYEVV